MRTGAADRLWRLLRTDQTPRTCRQLAERCGGSYDQIGTCLRHFVRDALVVRSIGHTPTYHLADPSSAPVARPSYDRAGKPIGVRPLPAPFPLWRAIRAQSKRGLFDVPLIAMIAGTSIASATSYINRLRRAGYLRLVAEQWRGKPAAYQLVRDTGPQPPRVDHRGRVSVVIDPNTGRRFDISPGRVCLRSKPSVADVVGGVG